MAWCLCSCKKLLRSILIVVGIFLFLIIIPHIKVKRISTAWKRSAIGRLFQEEKGKKILIWTKVFGSDEFGFDFGSSSKFPTCQMNQCHTTNDRSRLNQSDAVVFHMRDFNEADLPAHRLPHQRWIFFLHESPEYTDDILKGLGGFFNWTMTYRMDSDVYFPYTVDETSLMDSKLAGNQQMELGQYLSSRKTKLVAWFVSNCNTPGQREKYVAELQKHIQVDIYGKCGSLQCPYRGLECYKMLEKDYKFYLSFENSVCLDYFTEKFYDILLYKVVPIVYGGSNYSKLAPQNSFIDIRNFTSAKALADYLNFLDENDEKYLKYFEWRKTPDRMAALPRYFQPWCRLCRMLNDPSLPAKSYKDIHSWWFDQGNCRKEPPPNI